MGKMGAVLLLLNREYHIESWVLGMIMNHEVVEIWMRGEEMVIINYYKPKNMEMNNLLSIQGQDKNKEMVCRF